MLELVAKNSNLIGIVGVILLLIAYGFLNVHKMSAKSMSYQLLNFFGAFFILISLFYHWNTPAVLIEVAWMIISLVGIYNVLRIRYLNHSQK